MNTSIHKILVAAKALIDTPEKWTKGTLARDKNGTLVQAYSDEAYSFCTLGALHRASYTLGERSWHKHDARKLLLKCTGDRRDLAPWNDDKTTQHKDVMAAFNCAIAMTGEGK